MKKINPSTALKICYFFIAANAAVAFWAWYIDDKTHTIMMLSASMIWIVCALIWSKAITDQTIGD